jgi:hypothetical protein
MIEYTSATRPITARMAPLMSRRRVSGSADSGTKRMVPAMAAAARMTFSANTDGHDQTCRTVPETSRPSTAAPPATAAQTLTARVRCSLAKVPVMVERVAGITSAAPRPITARRPISSPAELAVMATADAAPKIDRPAISAHRRPKRSPMAPAGSSSEANTSE